MISLIQEPSALVFAQNPVVYRLQSAHVDGSSFAGHGMSQSIALVEVDDVLPGTNINIQVSESGAAYSILFDFVATPANDQQLPIYEQNPSPPHPVGSFEGYYQDIAARMGRSHLLSPIITIGFSYDTANAVSTITFTAIDATTTFEIEVENLTNAAVSSVMAAVSDTTPTNYASVYEIFGEANYNTGVFQSLFSGTSVPNTEGVSRVNIQNVLTAFCDALRWTPPNCTNIAAHRADNLRRFYFRYAEKYGTPTTQYSWAFGAIKKIIRGGIANNINQRADWLATRTLETSLLNTLPDGRTVAAHSPEFLVWYNYTGVFQSLKVEWQMYSRIDGSTETGVNSVISLYADPNDTLMIPALMFHDYKEVTAAVEIRLLNQADEAVSPWRRYTIDYRYREDERHLMFLNKFGVFETVRLTGAPSIGTELDRRESVHYVNDVMQTFEVEKKWRRSFTYRTGYLTQAECFALENLVASRYVFEVSVTEGYLPLRILDTKFTLDDGKQELWSLELKALPQMDGGSPTSDLWIRW